MHLLGFTILCIFIDGDPTQVRCHLIWRLGLHREVGLPPSHISYGNSNIKWAMAGRNRQKLELVRDEISHINASCSTVPILVADAFDEVGLGALMKDTKVDKHQL